MPGRLEFGFAVKDLPAAARRRPAERPFRLLLVGDFGGRSARAESDVAGLAGRRTHRVDLDSLDTAMARVAPRIAVGAGATRHELAIASLDDFHPDRLLARVPALQALAERHRQLRDPATFAAAAAEMAAPTGESDDAMLGRLLGGSAAAERAAPARPGAAAMPGTPAAAVDALIGRIVAPHVVAGAPPRQAQYVAGAEAALADALRAVLHDPAFQALEADWRAVHWLVTQLELDEQLQLHLFDATRDELRADLEAAGAAADWQRSGLYRALVQRSQDSGSAWTMIACDLAFDASAGDVALLAALGAVGAFCGAPLLGAARPALLGRSSFGAPSEPAPLGTEDAARWQALRTSALAPWLGLAAPRMLMRQPYGRRSDPIDRFDFEELGATPLPAQWLWGPPAFAVALLAARAFAAAGWDGDPNDDREIGDLPAATVEHDGERELQPCAEGWLGDAAAQAMLDAGVMPLVAARHRNAVQVRRVQSIADPPCALAGR